MYLYVENDQCSIGQKIQALEVIHEVYKDIGLDEQNIYRQLIVKFRYVKMLNNSDVMISHSELVAQLITRQMFDDARLFIRDYL